VNAWDDLSEAARELICERSELDIAEDYVALSARYDAVVAERDEYASGIPLICGDSRHDAKVRGLEARIAKAISYARFIDKHGTDNEAGMAKNFLGHLTGNFDGAADTCPSAVKVEAVRALADQLIATGSTWDGNEPGVGHDLLEILDGPEAPVAVKAMPLVPVSHEDMEDRAISSPAARPATPAPTLAAMVELATAARAEHDAEQRQLETAITTIAQKAALTIVRTDPVEQVAVHPSAVAALRAEIQSDRPSHHMWQAGITQHSPFASDYLAPGLYANLPLIPDDTVPPSEIHLRPHPRPADTA